MAKTVFNVLDILGDAGSDDAIDVTKRLEDLLIASSQEALHIPDAHPFIENSDRREHGVVIYFPTLEGTKHYVVSRTIDLPRNKSIRFLAATPLGARLQFVPDASSLHQPLFRTAPGGRRHLVFENLILDGGAVELAGDVVGATEFRSCVFTRIRGFAIRTSGPRVVNVIVTSCQFVETDRGIGVLHGACDNWLIHTNTLFVRLAGVGIQTRSSGISIRNCLFESKQAFNVGEAVRDEPYIMVGDLAFEPLVSDFDLFDGTEISGDQDVNTVTTPSEGSAVGVIAAKVVLLETPGLSGLVEIASCRFGGEVGTDHRNDTRLGGPPRYAIEARPTVERTATGSRIINRTVTGLRVMSNWFFGRTGDGGPNESSAASAIGLFAAPVDCVVMGNFFRPYAGAVIRGGSGSLAPQVKYRGNMLIGNTFEPKGMGTDSPKPAQVFETVAAANAWDAFPALDAFYTHVAVR